MTKLFNELSEANKAKAITDTQASYGYLDYEWFDQTETDFNDILAIIGYYDIETSFSGFHSQGDGASFTAKYSYEKGSVAKLKAYAPKDEELHRIVQELKNIQAKVCYDLEAYITPSGSNYCHEMTMSCECHSRRGNIKDDTANEYEDEILELSRDLARWYYKTLNNEYDYLMSDEAVREHIIANAEEFDYAN